VRAPRLSRSISAVLILGLTAAGCSREIPRPKLTGPPEDSDAAWSRVLDRFVDEEGRIDFQSLRKDSRDLEVAVDGIARRSPANRPDHFGGRDVQLAFWLNAYSALAVYGAVQSGESRKPSLAGVREASFRVGGLGAVTLRDLETIAGKRNDARIHFALSDMTRSAPRLPRRPFTGEKLNDELDQAARELLNDPQRVQVDRDRGVVRLPFLFDRFGKDFLAEAPTLIDFVNRYRSEKIPGDYRAEFLPEDRALRSK